MNVVAIAALHSGMKNDLKAMTLLVADLNIIYAVEVAKSLWSVRHTRQNI